VSRLHAALIRDPYQRWWIHDLGSSNGTYVNGSAVKERALNPGDTIQIGPYSLTLRVPSEALSSDRSELRATLHPRRPASDAPSTHRALGGAPEPLDANLVRDVIGFARSLLHVEDAQLRLKALCERAVNDRLPASWACVCRVRRDGSSSPLYGPVTLPRGDTSSALIPAALVAFCQAQHVRLLHDPGPHVFPGQPRPGETMVACVLDLFAGDVLFLGVAVDSDLREWTALFALLAESYGNANEFWRNRGQFSMNAAVQRELQMARQLQDSLIPRLPALEGLDLAIGYHPSRWVGGDYVDAVSMPDGRLLIAIADVCGKGLQAALVASSLHTLVHVLVEVCADLAELVQHMDAHLRRYLPIDSFVTMVCIALNAENGELECLNLGHPPPLLVQKSGQVRPLQTGQNPALGMMEFVPRSDRFVMTRSEVLFLYTDGLTELGDAASSSNTPDPADDELLPGTLAACVQIIRVMPQAPIEAIRDQVSQSLEIQLDLSIASDDAAFLLARLRDSPLPSDRHGATLRPGPGFQPRR
jgi:serine phosphatase RsbU (regulator of sigma subunit)